MPPPNTNQVNEVKRDQDPPIHDPQRMQELAIGNPEYVRLQRYIQAYFKLTQQMQEEVSKIATPYEEGDSAQSGSRGTFATQLSARSKVSIQEKQTASRSRSPKVITQRSSKVRSLTVPKSYGAIENVNIADDSSNALQDGTLENNSQAFRENTRRERSTDASMSTRESSRIELQSQGLLLKALADQKTMYQREASEMVQAIAASSEQQAAQAVAEEEREKLEKR